ncbi:MAG: cupin-like domain-containing protein, partial [Sphingomonadales bacterium]
MPVAEDIWAGTPRVPVIEGMTRERFEAEIVPAGRPVLLRGLVRDWPAVRAAAQSDEALADYLDGFPARSTIEAWFGAPAIRGRFGYSDDLKGFNHERRTLQLRELIAYLLEHREDASAFSAYAGGIPLPKVAPDLVPALPMPLLAPNRDMLVSLWIGGRSRTAAHW